MRCRRVQWCCRVEAVEANDQYNAVTLKNYFGEKKLKEIQPLDIERFKSKRLATETKHDTQRAPASVNREFEMLSRVYNLAIEVGKADSNPCQRVKKFKLDNERYRFLTPTEEADLMSWLIGPREHLHSMVISVPRMESRTSIRSVSSNAPISTI